LGLHLSDTIPTDEQSGLLARQCDDGKRFVVRTDEKLTAFVELESGVRRCRFFGVPGDTKAALTIWESGVRLGVDYSRSHDSFVFGLNRAGASGEADPFGLGKY
jgi:hypothetical protein